MSLWGRQGWRWEGLQTVGSLGLTMAPAFARHDSALSSWIALVKKQYGQVVKKIIMVISQQVCNGYRKLLSTLTHTQPTRLSALQPGSHRLLLPLSAATVVPKSVQDTQLLVIPIYCFIFLFNHNVACGDRVAGQILLPGQIFFSALSFSLLYFSSVVLTMWRK